MYNSIVRNSASIFLFLLFFFFTKNIILVSMTEWYFIHFQTQITQVCDNKKMLILF